MHPMVWLGLALLVLWAIAWLVLKVVSFAVHLLLIAAVLFVVWGLVKRGARKAGL
ncbi:MAG: hypothetical protein KY467_18185 [Gemmatimonadetes bacterium]|nr:hypothetical protein [Gemmatimonadota bacterium]